jgi:alkylation response protein AidB-like acyl-CoA dehydrogenase
MIDAAGVVAADMSRARANTLIAWLRDYAAHRINSRLIDERRCIPPYVILDFGNQGLLGMHAPEAFGGLGLRCSDGLRVLEQLGAIDLTLSTVVFTHAILGTRPIQGHASASAREELLPQLAQGRQLAAFALSEPGAGSNLGGIAGEARPNGRGGWCLRAVKRWNSSAWAGVVSVFVRLLDGRGRLGGLTGFIVRQGSPGLRIGPEALTIGMRGSVQNALMLDDVEASPGDLLGEPGRGMDVAAEALMAGRMGIAAVSLGGLRRCAQLLVRYGARRAVASGRLIENPVVLADLGELTAQIAALEALTDQVAAGLDAGRDVPPEAPMAAKVIGSEGLNWAAGRLVQFLGGRGYMENNLAPQILRDARLLTIGEGPNEPLTTQVGRRARHTDAIGAYLAADLGGPELAADLAGAVPEIVDRCLSESGPFADRSCAQLWADVLIGRVACEALLLAATRQAYRRRQHDALGRAVAWAQARFARALAAAREGRPEDRLIPTAAQVEAIVTCYADVIGDVEQGLAGADLALDPLLRRTFEPEPASQGRTLPGAIAADGRYVSSGSCPSSRSSR